VQLIAHQVPCLHHRTDEQYNTHEVFHDWQSYAGVRFVDRFRNHLFRSARACGPVRRKLEHGCRDYPRPLRTNPDWPWNKPQPNLFDWWFLRFLPNSVERARFRLGAGPDEGSGWPAHRPRDRTVQSVSGQRDVGWYRAFRYLLGRLDRRSEDETFVVEDEEETLGTYHLRANWAGGGATSLCNANMRERGG